MAHVFTRGQLAIMIAVDGIEVQACSKLMDDVVQIGDNDPDDPYFVAIKARHDMAKERVRILQSLMTETS